MNFYKLSEIIKNNIVINLLKESNKSLTLSESFEIARIIEDAIEEFGFDVTEPKDIEKVDTDSENSKLVLVTTKGGQIQKIKIGKILQLLVPDLDPTKSVFTNIINRIESKLNQKNIKKYYFKEFKNVSEWYQKVFECNSDSESCMTGNESLKVYDEDPNITVMVCFRLDNNNPVGRGLVWRNIKGLTKPYLDRTYPVSGVPMFIYEIRNAFVDYAKANGYDYKTTIDVSNTHNISGKDTRIEFTFNKPASQLDKMPYIDTLRFGNIIDDKMVVNNYSGELVFSSEKGTSLK